MKDSELRIIPVGGLGEIGLNCQLWETCDTTIMIDCGMMFPEDHHLGVDAVVPNLDIITARRNQIKAIVLTHGHEDHIGALPWILPALHEIPVYGSRFTLALVRHKLEEHGLLHKVQLIPVESGEVLTIAPFVFHFFPVQHSIPQSYALGVATPAGKVLHTGDFKFERCQEGTPDSLASLKNFMEDSGIRLLLADSTNVLRAGHFVTEREVRESLDHIFAGAKGRIVISLFSSNIDRIQEIFDLAEKYDREVVISGKSLASNIAVASSLGCVSLPSSFHNAYNRMPDLPPGRIVLIVTGAQGEPLASLSRMVLGQHRQLDIMEGDTVVMSSRVIPGHARAVSRLINEMYRLGAEVFYENIHLVHASGHANSEMLSEVIAAVNPEIFLPIHGEYQHLLAHCRLAEKCGVKPDNILCLTDGQPLLISPNTFTVEETICCDYTLVDGKGVGDTGPSVLRERRILSEDGTVAVSVALDAESGMPLGKIAISSYGFVYEPLGEEILKRAEEIVNAEIAKESNPEILKENIRSTLRRFFRRELERDPVILAHLIVIPSCSLAEISSTGL